MSGEQKLMYDEKINFVRDYISENLDENLTVEKLSQVANFSKYHFHRQFSSYVGMNVARYILMLRLKRASYQLVFKKDYRIIDIALASNFENHESFSRAFKKVFGQTPSQFRQNPQWQIWHERFFLPKIERNEKMDVEIIDFDETKVAVLEHRGPHELLNDSIGQFIQWRMQSGLSPVTSSRTFGLIYDDPETTEPEKFRFDICGEVSQDVPKNEYGIVNKTIPAGRCAMIEHEGAYEELDQKIRFLYAQWLPSSGEELRDFPGFAQYVNLFPEVPEHELLTRVYLPLK